MTKDYDHKYFGSAQSVTSEAQAHQILSDIEIVFQVNPFATADRIVNLFAGSANESAACLAKLKSVGNTTCSVVAVDKNPPVNNALATAHPGTFEYVASDVFSYLSTQAPGSVDLITAFGAEYVLRDQNLALFISEAAKILKPSGVFFLPLLGTNPREKAELEAAGFTMLITGLFQKRQISELN